MQIVKLDLGSEQIDKFEWPLSLNELLDRYPNSVYTALRTCGNENGRWNILQLTAHYQRLLHSASEKLPNCKSLQLEDLKRMLNSLLEDASKSCDHRLTVILISNREWDCSLLGFANVISSQPPSISIKMAIHKRSNPNIKSTDWIMERESLESLKGALFNEVVLMDDQGCIYEGLSSNFAIIYSNPTSSSDGPVLVTAPDEVILKGTVMNVVLEACRILGWRLERRLISINELRDQFHCAFITSTSRMVLPVETISLCDGSTIILNTQFTQITTLIEKFKEILPSYCEQI